jgi:hypothetical protein
MAFGTSADIQISVAPEPRNLLNLVVFQAADCQWLAGLRASLNGVDDSLQLADLACREAVLVVFRPVLRLLDWLIHLSSRPRVLPASRIEAYCLWW